MDKQREMRLCACKAHWAKTAGQALRQAGRQAGVTFPPSQDRRQCGVGGWGLRLGSLSGWLRTGQDARHCLSQWVHQKECGLISFCLGLAMENKGKITWGLGTQAHLKHSPELSLTLRSIRRRHTPRPAADSSLAQQLGSGRRWKGQEYEVRRPPFTTTAKTESSKGL